ncbi:M15 family metallopeptidase [Jonesia quinghaiensis]|uniref:M15 family metallopeptidase n=1 Tax=Jonesia quinghaiensis TaxID=262806 RepID=UPI000403696D|nr:M15 family metallopeptidase [Jonesia quinghaiensis]
MDGIAAISARMMEIQNRIDMLGGMSAQSLGGTATQATSGAQSTSASGTNAVQEASFEDALNTAMEQAQGTTAVAAPAAQWTADGVPKDLVKYGNGKVPREALDAVGNTGHRLWAPASASLEKLMAAAKRDGVDIGITDSYRPIDVQHDLVRRKGLYSQGGLAAAPGTSPHGWGIAVDLKLDNQAQAWMRANGKEYGFIEDTPREPWHWVFRP